MLQIKIVINGEEKFIASNTTIADLILQYELDVKKIAIEKDLEIINPNDFAQIILNEGSRIEIVHFIGGG